MIRGARNTSAKRWYRAHRSFCIALTLAGLALPAAGAELRLLRTQAVTVQSAALAPNPATANAPTLRVQLLTGNARHDLRLRPNTQLGTLAGRLQGRATAYEGRVGDRAGTWAAVTRIGDRWTGIWFDGAEYFGIDEAGALGTVSEQAAELPADRLLLFRLRDAVWLDADFHDDTRLPARTAGDVAGMVGQELAAPGSQLALLPTRRLTVALLGDADLARQDGAQTEANMLAQLNVVDGIFANQVGVRVTSGSVTIFNAGNDPFTSTTDASTLLQELRNYRGASGTQRAAGLSQLMTGRNLDGRTVGIAYLSSLCSPTFSASLSQSTSSVSFAALITAHEIGHVFGAPHDTEAGSACETAPTGFLMAPQLNGSQTFSSCSLEAIAPVVAGAACLAPADAADASVEAPTQVLLALNRTTDVTITVRSVGNISVSAANLRITLPLSMTLLDASGPGASCAAASNVVDCTLGTLPAGISTTVTLRVLTGTPGSSTAAVRVTATGDALRANDTASIRFDAEPGADLVAGLQADPPQLDTGGSTTVIATLENRGPAGVSDARLAIAVPAGLSITQQSAENITCAGVTGGLTCGPVALSAGSSARVQLVLASSASGSLTVSATASSSRAEFDPSNDRALLSLTVRNPAGPTGSGGSGSGGSTGGGGSGGGGKPSMPSVAALAVLTLLEGWRRLQARAKYSSR